MDEKKTLKLAQIIKTLKEELTCPICLDIIQDSIEFCCGHKLCSDCYLKCKSTKLVCPVCKTAMKRRSSLYKDEYLDHLGEFIAKLCVKFEEIHHFKAEELVYKKIREKDVKPNKNERTANPKITQNKTNRRTSSLIEPTEENAFDKLLAVKLTQNSLKVNKGGQKRVYSNRKKSQDEQKYDFKLLDFENDKTKEFVQQWLSDTRNKFDRLTQTQDFNNADDFDGVFVADNLPSISQRKTLDDFVKPISIVKKGRSRSADLELKRKKHSDRCSDLQDNYNIEDVNTEEDKLVEKAEENVLLNLIEDNFLDKLETELEHPAKQKERSRKSSEGVGKVSLNSTVVSNSGWERVSEMQRSLKKNPKEPKQLKILVETTQIANAKKEDGCTESIRVEKMDSKSIDAVMVVKADNKVENKENIENLMETVPTKSYDLNTLENYISENIELVAIQPNDRTTSSNQDPTASTSKSNLNDQGNGNDKHSVKENNVSKINVIEHVIIRNITDFNNDDETEVDKLDVDPFMIATQKLPESRNNSNCEDKVKDDSTNDDRDFIKPTQKLNLNITEEEEGKGQDYSSKNIEYTEPEDDVVIFKSQTDILETLESNINTCINSITNISRVELKKKLHLLSAYVKKLKNISKPDKIEISMQTNTIQTVDKTVETMTVDSCHKGIQTDIEIIDRGVQTTLTENSYSQNNSEQFFNEQKASLRINLVNCITQGTKNALETFWSEPDISVPNTLKEMQNKMASDELNLPPPTRKQKTQNEVFTAGFDNVNFDTQEVAKKILDGKVSLSRRSELGNELEDDEDLVRSGKHESGSPGPAASKESHLECTVPPSNAKNFSRRKLSVETDQNKTKRNRISSDSESDEEIRPRRKKRLLFNDLSIEFESNTERVDLQKSGLTTSESENINYDDCLNEILKNYDDNGTNTKLNKSKETTKKERTQKSTENFLEECDKIIAEVNRNVENLTKKNKNQILSNEHSNSSEEQSVGKRSSVIQQEDGNTKNSQKNLLAERKNSEFSDVIEETESFEPIPKKAKSSLKRDSALNRHNNIQMRDSPQKNPDGLCDELNDSFDEAELEKIDVIGKNNSEIARKSSTFHRVDAEDDMFAEDEDIVAISPQKKRNASGLWEPERAAADNLNHQDIDKNLSQEIEDFDLDLALPPPPDFQDHLEIPPDNEYNERNPSPDQITIIDIETTIRPGGIPSSLTPDDLSQYLKKETPKKPGISILRATSTNKDNQAVDPDESKRSMEVPEPSRKSKFDHSTPTSHRDHINVETLGFSPIQNEDGHIKSLEHPRTTINFSRQTPSSSKQTIMTSTPKQKSILNYVRPCSTQLNENEDLLQQQLQKSSPKIKQPCIACTRLSGAQISSITQLANRKLATYSNVFNGEVTHMIVAVDQNNCLKDYTVKFVAAVAAGLWVLRYEWVVECLKHNCIVPEDRFEVLDDSGGVGPKTARLTRKENPLFRNFKFYCPNQFVSTSKDDIEDILRMLGGKIVAKPEYLRERDGRIALIVTEGRATQDFDIYEKWLETFKVATVDIEWLSKSVGRYKVLSIRPYVWCTDDNLADYDYPDYLIENVPYTVPDSL